MKQKFKLVKQYKFPGMASERYIFEHGLLSDDNYLIKETKKSVKIYKKK